MTLWRPGKSRIKNLRAAMQAAWLANAPHVALNLANENSVVSKCFWCLSLERPLGWAYSKEIHARPFLCASCGDNLGGFAKDFSHGLHFEQLILGQDPNRPPACLGCINSLWCIDDGCLVKTGRGYADWLKVF